MTIKVVKKHFEAVMHPESVSDDCDIWTPDGKKMIGKILERDMPIYFRFIPANEPDEYELMPAA